MIPWSFLQIGPSKRIMIASSSQSSISCLLDLFLFSYTSWTKASLNLIWNLYWIISLLFFHKRNSLLLDHYHRTPRFLRRRQQRYLCLEMGAAAHILSIEASGLMHLGHGVRLGVLLVRFILRWSQRWLNLVVERALVLVEGVTEESCRLRESAFTGTVVGPVSEGAVNRKYLCSCHTVWRSVN